MSSQTSAPPPRGTLTAPKIVFFVIAATAPMAAMVATVPFGFALGTGPGMPAAYVLAGVTMLCFVSGYAAMSRKIVHAGALYSYIRAGLGRIPGAAAAWLALLSYNVMTVGLIGAFAHFADLIVAAPAVTWHWYAAAVLALVAVLGRRQIEMSAWMLGIVMMAEIAILLVMDIGIVSHRGAEALPAVSFSPDVALGAGIGAALTFAFTSFTGIESAALYGEEARDARRSVSLAVCWSVVIIAVFYGLTSWLAVGGVGPDHVRSRAGEEGGELFFSLNTQYTSAGLTDVMALLLVTSFLASTLAMHNATSRYLYALGRERLLPRWLGVTHTKHGSPHRASAAQSVLAVLLVGGFALAGLDPYMNLATSMVSLGTLGIMVLLLGTSVAVLVYFARHRADRHWWNTTLAPALALGGLGTAMVLILQNYAHLTGTHSTVVNTLPYLIVLAAVVGAARALWLRKHHPHAYRALDPKSVSTDIHEHGQPATH
ncbi:APC family permease [Streptomyces sp. NPDC008343]|uniref:APC family permease n=1 Tax=Streptomyces sp. NPDC008343 TaxID=3364828 RepID=UPI0036EC1DA8